MKLNIILLCFLMLFSCQNDDDSNGINGSKTDIKLVTGMHARSSEFGPSIVLGNPNIMDDGILVYPNPAIGSVVIRSNTNLITDIWLVKANPQKKYQNVNFSEILSTDLYNASEILSNSELIFSNLTTSNLSINLENISFGYYKVFVKIDNAIFWSNIYVGNDKEIDELINFWN